MLICCFVFGNHIIYAASEPTEDSQTEEIVASALMPEDPTDGRTVAFSANEYDETSAIDDTIDADETDSENTFLSLTSILSWLESLTSLWF